MEATSNQVDSSVGTRDGPDDFRELVLGMARGHGLPEARCSGWGSPRPEPVAEAPRGGGWRTRKVVEAYVTAGFAKIHLDCSMPLGDDPAPPDDDLVAERAARLARTAERAAARGTDRPLYVVGTEVPIPGGAHEALGELKPTPADAARDTIERHERAFAEAGLEDAWERVISLVVQPGVEFDHMRVIDYERAATGELRRVPEDHPHLVFEAHSTDYQTPGNLKALVEDHWAILKVGPGLTFAMREALYALAAIEDELFSEEERSELPSVVERRMLADPAQWEKYYRGDPRTQRLLRRYSYSDRIRYYWPDPEIHAAQERLLSNLADRGIPRRS